MVSLVCCMTASQWVCFSTKRKLPVSIVQLKTKLTFSITLLLTTPSMICTLLSRSPFGTLNNMRFLFAFISFLFPLHIFDVQGILIYIWLVVYMFNPYEHMKSKCKKNFDDINHFQYLLITLISMFEWSGLPDTINSVFLESVLISNGTAGVARFPDGELYTGIGSYCGDYKNFMPTRYLITNAGIGEYEGGAGEQVAVCWNNSLRYPDTFLYQYASILTEIDVSERCNVLFTRLLRIPRVSDSKEKTEIEECVKSMLNGNFTATTRKALQSDLFTSDNPENRFFDLADVDKVDKLQYLNQYRDNIIKRWYQMYGQGMQSTAKLAQQTTDELHGNDGVSMILPLDRLAQRKKFCEDMNRLFGTSVSVDFSESYAESYEEMTETYSNGVRESTPEEGGANDE